MAGLPVRASLLPGPDETNVRRSHAHRSPTSGPHSRHVEAPESARATLRSSILELNHRAGNRAVAGLLQRKVGWTDGKKWNDDEHPWGEIRRIPLEGLAEGLDARCGAPPPEDPLAVVGERDRQGDRARPEGAERALVDRGHRLPARLHRGPRPPVRGLARARRPKPSTAGLEDVLKERSRACARASTGGQGAGPRPRARPGRSSSSRRATRRSS